MKNLPTSSSIMTVPHRLSGFSLLEVLVALLVISFGLLGIAGMQAISISNTNSAGFRGIAAMQVSSITAAMGANELYWQQTTATTGTQVSGTPSSITITGNDANLNGTGLSATTPGSPCLNTICSATAMAKADLTTWGGALAQALPGGNGQIACLPYSAVSTIQLGPGVSIPKTVACTISVYWTEKSVVKGQSTSVASNSGQTNHYDVVVQP